LTSDKKESSAVEGTALAVLEGMNISDSALVNGLEFNNHTKIREFEDDEEKDFIKWGFERSNYDYYVIESTNVFFKNVLEDINIIKKILFTLRLYKNGDVFIRDIYFKPNKTREIQMRVYGAILPHIFELYILNDTDVHQLKELFNKIQKIDFNNELSLRVAFDRFNKCYEDYRFDDKLIDLCISFEALYLKNEPSKSEAAKGEIIGLACSMLIGENQDQRKKIQENIMKAYNIRNHIVHGKHEDMEKNYELVQEFEKYLRSSILKIIS
jgi:hypothetical protein